MLIMEKSEVEAILFQKQEERIERRGWLPVALLGAWLGETTVKNFERIWNLLFRLA